VIFQFVQLTTSFTPLCFRHNHDYRTNTKLALTQDEYDKIRSASSAESSTSTQFAMDPHSEEAKALVTTRLGLSLAQCDKLTQLAELIVSWNDRINIISRRDCTTEVVFGRHVLPSLALLALRKEEDSEEGLLRSSSVKNIVDVGTGGGFPGLPLAIALPDVNFVLVDSVGKKLIVVQDMIRELGLDNVSIHHGRAEDMADDLLIGRIHRKAYDICVGRSVTSIPRFCFWMQDLLKEIDGKLLYIIGGELDEEVLQNAEVDMAIDELLLQPGSSDKRIMVFPQAQVKSIARNSGEVKQFRGSRRAAAGPNPSKREKVKGAWSKRDKDGAPKQRGMENFKRYGY
jgi:16S rRNA (guanine527-N7)-methyltransferase